MSWFVYLARCADGTLYCGIARDVAARIAAHDAGKGARYTRGRGPLVVLVVRRCRDKGRALRLEHAIKQLTRREKQQLIAAPRRVLAALVRAGREPRVAARSRGRRHDGPRRASRAARGGAGPREPRGRGGAPGERA